AAVEPLRRDFLAVVQTWRTAAGGTIAAAKGAPEAIAGLCNLDAAARAALEGTVAALGAEGFRVLAVARRDDGAFRLVGLLGYLDP
ncbi:hypothetical protein J8J27_31315, partial [Mycobacterium tuberculosis]|nr:hypothetical protein [Mycobacterium tuberculosis]